MLSVFVEAVRVDCGAALAEIPSFERDECVASTCAEFIAPDDTPDGRFRYGFVLCLTQRVE